MREQRDGHFSDAVSHRSSPDGRIVVAFSLADARATYSVSVGGKEILRRSRLGVVRDDADFTATSTSRLTTRNAPRNSRKSRTGTSC